MELGNVQQNESLLKQIAELREATWRAESRIQQLAKENDTLNKHFERLSHLQLVNTFPGRADCLQSMTSGHGRAKASDVCYSCGRPGHYEMEWTKQFWRLSATQKPRPTSISPSAN